MRYFSNIKAEYVWRVWQDGKLVDPFEVEFEGGAHREELNRNHINQSFFTDRDQAYQKLDQWLDGWYDDHEFVLIEIVSRKTR